MNCQGSSRARARARAGQSTNCRLPTTANGDPPTAHHLTLVGSTDRRPFALVAYSLVCIYIIFNRIYVLTTKWQTLFQLDCRYICHNSPSSRSLAVPRWRLSSSSSSAAAAHSRLINRYKRHDHVCLDQLIVTENTFLFSPSSSSSSWTASHLFHTYGNVRAFVCYLFSRIRFTRLTYLIVDFLADILSWRTHNVLNVSSKLKLVIIHLVLTFLIYCYFVGQNGKLHFIFFIEFRKV